MSSACFVYAVELKSDSHFPFCLTCYDDDDDDEDDDDDDDDCTVDAHFRLGQFFRMHFIPEMFYSFNCFRVHKMLVQTMARTGCTFSSHFHTCPVGKVFILFFLVQVSSVCKYTSAAAAAATVEKEVENFALIVFVKTFTITKNGNGS